jgi:hypothetical protein
MTRLAVLALLLAAVVAGTARTAQAAAPCRDRIYNDWYADGKIASNYPIACFRDALKHVPADARIYSSLSTDIQSAMQAALRRAQGKPAPAQIGKGRLSIGVGSVAGTSTTKNGPKPAPLTPTSPPGTVAVGASSGSGSGIPTPIIVLGGLALLLAAAGAAGAGLKHFRGR